MDFQLLPSQLGVSLHQPNFALMNTLQTPLFFQTPAQHLLHQQPFPPFLGNPMAKISFDSTTG